MILSYQITEQDYFEYSYYTAWQAPWNKKKRFIYLLRTPLFGLLFIAILIYTIERKTPSSVISSVLIFFLIYIVLLRIMIKDNFRRSARKIYNDPKNASLFSKAEMSFDKMGISAKDENSQVHYNWSAVIKKETTQNLYLLYLSEITAVIIPKRIFKLQSEKESFEKMLAEHLPLQADLPSVDK